MTTSPVAISRILGKSYRRSSTNATRIRGWHYVTEGFRVRSERDGTVSVEYRFSDSHTRAWAEDEEKRKSILGGMAKRLSSAGYEAEVTENSWATILRVRKAAQN